MAVFYSYIRQFVYFPYLDETQKDVENDTFCSHDSPFWKKKGQKIYQEGNQRYCLVKQTFLFKITNYYTKIIILKEFIFAQKYSI